MQEHERRVSLALNTSTFFLRLFHYYFPFIFLSPMLFFLAPKCDEQRRTHRLYPSINKLIFLLLYQTVYTYVSISQYTCTAHIHQKLEWWNKSKKKKKKKTNWKNILKYFSSSSDLCVIHGIWCLWEFHMVSLVQQNF